MKNILVATACLHENTTLVNRLELSCVKQNIPFRTFGVGTPFVNYVQAKINCFLDFLPTVKQEYILYTDGFDSFLIKGYYEILKRFVEQYHKIIIAGSHDCYPDVTLKDKFPVVNKDGYNYLCAGQFMGKTKDVIEVLKRIQTETSSTMMNSDQKLWQQAFTKQIYDIGIDYNRRLFQTVLYAGKNKIEDTCVLHFGGGKGGSPNELFMNQCYNNYI